MSHQYSLALIQHETNGTIVDQRKNDGYINATALCKAAGKKFNDYRRLDSTTEFLDLLADIEGVDVIAGNPAIKQKQALIETRPGSPESGGGTWVHPDVAVHLAQWASAKFAVMVAKWVREWMTSGTPPTTPTRGPALPPHLNRYLANDSRIPGGYFSILQETGLSLFGPLHMQGFDVPQGWVPDISVGRLFCKHLRDVWKINTDLLPTYRHDYLDGRDFVQPKLYPDTHLAEFRRWFRESWLPEHGVRYFRSKDPSSLVFLDRIPALAGPSTGKAVPLPPR